MKARKLLLAAAALFVCSAAVQAQTVRLFTTPVTRVIKSNRTALAGNVIIEATQAGTGAAGQTLEVSFGGLTVTNLPDDGDAVVESGEGISVAAPLASTWAGGAVILAVDNAAGVVTIQLTGASGAAGEQIILQGVRVNVENTGGPVVATITSTQIAITPPNQGTVIQSTQAGITNPPTVATSASFLSTGITVVGGPTVVTITEDFINAWRGFDTTVLNQMGLGHTPDGAAVDGTDIMVTVAGLPAGVTATAAVGGTVTGTGVTIDDTTFTSTDTTTILTIGDGTDPTTKETITLTFTYTVPVPATPYPASTATLVVDFEPVAAATPAGPVIPRFAPLPTTAVTIFSIIPAETNLLFNHASVLAGVTDTGIAVANTTKDPLGTKGAVPQTAATVTVTMYDQDGTGTTFTPTDDSVGSGLASNGSLVAGASWVFQLSELLAAAGAGPDFTGYLWIQVAATHADGLGILFTTNGSFAHGYGAQTIPVGSVGTVLTAAQFGKRLPLDESVGQ